MRQIVTLRWPAAIPASIAARSQARRVLQHPSGEIADIVDPRAARESKR